MKIIYGDLFDPALLKGADALAITTNGMRRSDGSAIMGAGVAKIAAQKYPTLPKVLGRLLKENGNITQVMGIFSRGENKPLTLVAFPTKHHWKQPSDLALIENSARQLSAMIDYHSWKTVLISPPGCGLGGLKFSQVKPLLEKFPFTNEFLTVVFLKK